MKKGMLKLLDMLALVGLLAMGGWMIYSSLFDEALNTAMLDAVRNTPFYGVAVGLFLIFSVVLRFLARKGRVAKGEFINFHSGDGSVGISTKAICDFIERIGKEFSAIKSIDSKLIHGKGFVDIALSVKVASGNKIPELSQTLQQRIREGVRESLGLEEIRNITINVNEIVGDPDKPVPEYELADELAGEQ